jgi:predicted PurR-regulated permease PerM
MNLLSKIKKWPIERKRTLAISLALFLTIIVIVINSLINSIWPDNSKKANLSGNNNPLKSLEESFSKIFEQAKPILDRAFSSSTQNTATDTSLIIDQNNSTSSSLSTSSNIVE